ncbi:hypothetical protein GCM10010443_77060 [Actinoplanes cyaneus]
MCAIVPSVLHHSQRLTYPPQPSLTTPNPVAYPYPPAKTSVLPLGATGSRLAFTVVRSPEHSPQRQPGTAHRIARDERRVARGKTCRAARDETCQGGEDTAGTRLLTGA